MSKFVEIKNNKILGIVLRKNKFCDIKYDIKNVLEVEKTGDICKKYPVEKSKGVSTKYNKL